MGYRKLAEFSIRRYKGIIACWLLAASVSAAFAIKLPDVLGDHGLRTNGPYSQAQKLLQSEWGIPGEPIILLFEQKQESSARDFRTYVSRSLAEVEAISGVDVAASPLDRKDMQDDRYAYAVIAVQGSSDAVTKTIDRIRGEIKDNPRFGIRLTGKPVVQDDVNRSSRRDLKTAETLGIPVAFVLLLLTFGGLWPALIPILAGILSVVIAMGLTYAIGALEIAELSVFVYNVIPMAGMAVCIDFALLMVSRYREERATLSSREAILRTTAYSGRAVTVSVVCVIFALLGTLFIRMPIFNSVALTAMIVVAIAALINLTFVPALLYALGHRLGGSDNGKAKPLHTQSRRLTIVNAAMKRPIAAVVLSAAFLIVCLLPIREMRLTVPGPESLPVSTESREAAAIVANRFLPSGVSRLQLIGSEQNIDRIRAELASDPSVLRVETEASNDRDRHLLTVLIRGDASSAAAREWIHDRERTFRELDVIVGGEPKYRQEIHDEIFGRMKQALVFLMASNYLVLAWAFRSLLIPAKAIAMNLLSIGASFGIVAWMFQQGLWGIEPTDVAIMIPVFIFGLTFGISMDYGIFLYARMFESYNRFRDNEASVREGMAASAGIITSAAAIMIAVTAPFALAGVSGVKQLGIGIAAALFIDATVIRLILVPSLMTILGKWNWRFPFVRS